MSIFTNSIMEGMGLLSMTPMSVRKLRPKSRLCSQVRVLGRDGREYVLVGTSVFSQAPLGSDWMAVGNDLRLGHIRFLIEEGAHGEEESNLQHTETATH